MITRVLAMCVVACSSPALPPVTPGQVVVIGDTTFRTRDAGAIEVTVKRRFGDHEAAGAATLQNMTLDAAEHSSLVGVAAARAWRVIDSAVTEPAEAFEVIQRALDELGTDYRDVKGSRHLMDDTGLSVIHAKMSAQHGDYVGANQELVRVLDDRVAMYLKVFASSVE